jgi:CRISPR-associated exonuclease Cas4
MDAFTKAKWRCSKIIGVSPERTVYCTVTLPLVVQMLGLPLVVVLSAPASWIALGAFLALLLGLWLVLAGRGIRLRRGLGGGKTVSLDRVTLTSVRLGLTGRPDRLIKADGTVVIEEWKSSPHPRPWHRVQLGAYFLLIEEQLRIRPPYGFIVCGDGTRHRVENDPALRALVLDLAGQIRAARASVDQPIPVHPVSSQCRPCGQRANCGQARL